MAESTTLRKGTRVTGEDRNRLATDLKSRYAMVFRQANAPPAWRTRHFLVAPPRPRRATPVSVRMRWMKPYDRPVAIARERMDSPAS